MVGMQIITSSFLGFHLFQATLCCFLNLEKCSFLFHFAVSLCFAMTINKSQGQTIKAVGIDMTDESFTHGMLYVALSRVGSPDCLTLLVREDHKTRNVVYSEVFVC